MKPHPAYAALFAAALLPAGCGPKHVVECDGGMHVFVYFPPEQLAAADRLYVRVTVTGSGATWENTWPASQLDPDGADDLVLHFEVSEPTLVEVYAELRDSLGIPLVFDFDTTTVQPLTTGCQDFTLNLGGAGPDAGSADAPPIDAVPPPDACFGPDCIDAGDPDARPDAFGGMDAPSGFDSNPNDFDGDGVPDGSDNCEFNFNPDQNDEDGDGPGDVCDNCPITPNDQTNSDGDGVGDPCDPHQNDPSFTDYLQWMDGFGGATGPVSSAYVATGGSWIKASGSAQNMTIDADTALHLLVTAQAGPIGPSDELRIATRMTVNVLGTGAERGPGVTVHTSGGLDDGWLCHGLLDQDQIEIVDLGDKSIVASAPMALTTGVAYTSSAMSFENSLPGGQNLSCVMSGGFAGSVDQDPPPLGNTFGLHVVGAGARFEYLFVVRSTGGVVTPPMDGGLD